MIEIRERAAKLYQLQVAERISDQFEITTQDVNIEVKAAYLSGYDYAKRNDPDVKALVDVLDHAMEIGYFNGFGSTEMMAKDAIKDYRKAIEGEK